MATNQRYSLIVEDDVIFHSDAKRLFPTYLKEIPRNWGVIYVGQLSRRVFDHDPHSVPLINLTQSLVMPWCTHAYLITHDTARFLSLHLEHLLSRSGSKHASAKHFLNSRVSEQSPWYMDPVDMKIDFFMLSVHNYYVLNHTDVHWFTFESTALVPAQLMEYSWSKNVEIELGNGNIAGDCAWGKPGYVSCEDALHLGPEDPRVACGLKSGRLPILGTGLAFQNKCKVNPFAIYGWAKNATTLPGISPSCNDLRAQIRPTNSSDRTPIDCQDVFPASSV